MTECNDLFCLMEYYRLKLVTPSEAVLYLLKTFVFQMKRLQKNVDVLNVQSLSDNFYSFWNNYPFICYWCLWCLEKCSPIFLHQVEEQWICHFFVCIIQKLFLKFRFSVLSQEDFRALYQQYYLFYFSYQGNRKNSSNIISYFILFGIYVLKSCF